MGNQIDFGSASTESTTRGCSGTGCQMAVSLILKGLWAVQALGLSPGDNREPWKMLTNR